MFLEIKSESNWTHRFANCSLFSNLLLSKFLADTEDNEFDHDCLAPSFTDYDDDHLIHQHDCHVAYPTTAEYSSKHHLREPLEHPSSSRVPNSRHQLFHEELREEALVQKRRYQDSNLINNI